MPGYLKLPFIFPGGEIVQITTIEGDSKRVLEIAQLIVDSNLKGKKIEYRTSLGEWKEKRGWTFNDNVSYRLEPDWEPFETMEEFLQAWRETQTTGNWNMYLTFSKNLYRVTRVGDKNVSLIVNNIGDKCVYTFEELLMNGFKFANRKPCGKKP